MGKLADFEIRLSPDPAECQYLIDGKEIPGVVGFQLAKMDATDLPVVVLSVIAAQIDLRGLGGAAITIGGSIGDFLDDVDPEELASEALSAGNFATPPIEAALEILKERARAAAQ